ncbi:tyrosine-type recombinase/integrase [Pelagibacterium mangrovi]|uniref:tyrosine-type recombinase/integrase n=1 Tax=Pelagibacterium mangrovi TaxID=3119828 RepID=UPI002FC5D40C
MSNKIKLTDAVANRSELPSGKSDVVYWDTELTGFGLRVRAISKTWFVSYRPVGYGRSSNSKRFKIGSAQVLGAAEARRMARVILGQVAEGRDPAAERAELKRQERSRLRDVLDDYEKSLKGRGYVNADTVMSTLRRNLRPLLGKDVKLLSAEEILAIPASYEHERPGAAADFINRAKTFFSWCKTKRSLISHNPLSDYRKDRKTRQEKIEQEEYGRKLSDKEIVAVWFAASRDHSFDRFIRFAILTGCRRNEGALFDRAWLDRNDAGAIYRIPKRVTKSGRDHDLPITKALSAFLEKCPVTPDVDLFFPSAKTGRKMSGWSSQVESINKRSGVEFNLHDLRRTFRSGLTELGVDKDIAEISINHARKGLEAVYDRYDAAREMRAAFDKWGNHIDRLIKSEMECRRLRYRPQRRTDAPMPTAEEMEAEEFARQEERQAYYDYLEETGELDKMIAEGTI